MKKTLFSLIVAMSMVACTAKLPKASSTFWQANNTQSTAPAVLKKSPPIAQTKLSRGVSSDKLIAAEDSASAAGRKILRTGRLMALKSKEIVRGSCWDYINTVYNRSGYPQKKRQYILKGKKRSGPYAKPGQIQAGDWLYYINHSYNGVEHSGIFVYWVNKAKRQAVTLSYGGESRRKPGRYRVYDLSNVYTIIRAK